MSQITTTLDPPELWMELKDRELLKELMETHGFSRRSLAAAIGWSSHTYLNRLLSDDPKRPKTLKPEAALRIAYELKVPAHRLFVTRVSGESARNVRKKVAA